MSLLYCCYAYHFSRIGCTLFKCDMYMCRLRLINDPVLSSLKMEGIRLLLYSAFFCFLTASLSTSAILRFYQDIIMTCALADSFCSLVPNPPPQPALPRMCLRNGSQPSPFHNPRSRTCAYVTNLCGECAVNKVIRNITSPKTYKCQNWSGTAQAKPRSRRGKR
jgi:hypothetical protein